MGKIERVKGEVSRPEAMFLSYCKKSPLIKLNRSGSLRDWSKLEGFSGVMVENTS